eukprot:9079941-Ditylum_brightwellii.AAC.1
MDTNQFATNLSETIQSKNSIKLAAVTKRVTDIEDNLSYMKTVINNINHPYNINNDNLTLKFSDDISQPSKIASEISTLKSIVATQKKSINNTTSVVYAIKN